MYTRATMNISVLMVEKYFPQFCPFSLFFFSQKLLHFKELGSWHISRMLFIPTNSHTIAFSNPLPPLLLCVPLIWHSPHIHRSVKAHSPSTIIRLSRVFSLSARQSCVMGDWDSWAVPHCLIKTANAQAVHESVSQNVGEWSAWGVSECEPARCNQRRLFAVCSDYGLQQQTVNKNKAGTIDYSFNYTLINQSVNLLCRIQWLSVNCFLLSSHQHHSEWHQYLSSTLLYLLLN